jgi:predicted dehydrogenase
MVKTGDLIANATPWSASMGEPFRLGIIGCGAHVRSQHVPALLALRERVTVVACADPNSTGRAIIRQHWPEAVEYTESADLLAEARCQAVLVATPSRFTADLARAVKRSGKILWIEKPIAASLNDAEQLITDLGDHPAMVSLNRRFDPAFAALIEWAKGRRLLRVEAEMARENRSEANFITETAIHLVDVMLACSGPLGPLTVTAVDGGHHIAAQAGETEVELRIVPQSGRNAERLRLVAADGEAEGASGWFDSGDWSIRDAQGIRGQRGDRSQPDWQRNGTLAETEAFLAACAGQRPCSPKPVDFLPVARCCDEIARSASTTTAAP